jgi:hypothetical protein
VVFLYVDDKIIPSANVEWGLERLHLVLDVFRRHNLTIKMPRQKLCFKEYVMRHHKVYRRLSDGKVAWVVPCAARWQIVKLCHDQARHLGVENTLRKIQQNY